jgi:hypothetical protein
MLVKEIKSIAMSLGIKPGKLKKAELIKAIQLQEGNFDCFGTAIAAECDQTACVWRKDCFTTAKAA